MVDGEPLDRARAKALIREILETGSVSYSKRHADEELEKDRMSRVDVVNVLRGGWVDPAELRDGTWRYCVHTPKMAVVVAFRSETEIRVVTAWREKSR